MKFVGLDAGSVSIKVVVLSASGEKLQGHYKKHRGHPVETALELLKETIGSEEAFIAITGSAGRLIAGMLGIEPVNEIVSQAFSTGKLYPHIKTIIEMGGEDSKLVLMEGQTVKDFSMNSVCAAGTGSFLDQQAERLRLTIEEFSEMALKSKKPPRVAGRCSVFAKSDMIHLQQIATSVEDIVAGLCFAVARNFKGTISRGRKIIEPVSFQGGVAANKGMVRAFREVLGTEELFIPPDFALMGAMGAAMKSMKEGVKNRLDIRLIEDFIKSDKTSYEGHMPLFAQGDDFFERHSPSEQSIPLPETRVKAYMGVDIGSISTNLAVMDKEGNLLAKRYLMTAGRPIEAVMQGLSEIAAEVGDKVEIAGVATTGSGRYMIADYIGADIVKNEITAQATAAAYIDKDVDTIFEIGGQDSKYISLRDGVIVDFEMNKACAAGTGSFLEEQAEKLDISIKGEFAEQAFSSGCPTRLGERCTVFMENSLIANLQKGIEKNNLLAGLAYSIVQNYINRVVAGKPVGKNIFFQGGVAFNKSVVAAFEKHTGKSVTVPPNHDVTGAIGMALIAKRHMEANGKKASSFKGFDLSKRPYKLSSFSCKGCPNVCEINRVKIEGEKDHLHYGGRCEKYDINKKAKQDGIPDLFKFRDEKLRSVVRPPSENGKGKGPVLGIPNIFYFHDYLPYWWTLLDRLGFEVVVSPETNRQVVGLGLESVLSEACFPVKVAHGHIRHLKDSGVDAVFLPSFINLNADNDEFLRGLACPYTQTLPYVAKVAIEGLKTISPPIDMMRGRGYMTDQLKRAFGDSGMRVSGIETAIRDAEKAQREFETAVKQKGGEVISSIKEKTLVIVGRAYNSFERGMNLQIPEKLATLGVQSIPMDMLPLGETGIKESWPNMYWRSGQRILNAARYIADHPLLYPIYIGNFSCGPDSFILKFFKEDLKEKPFLHIEIDEHSADAGAITRCEAFLDSIENRKPGPGKAKTISQKPQPSLTKKKTVFVPLMADHAWGIAAAFEHSGVAAEVLPESDRDSVDLGMKYVSGKECYPCIVTTGDMVKKALSSDFRPEESAFFMPSGTGPCRFGQYNVFHRKVLEDLGFDNVPVFAPNQDVQFYRDLGFVGKDFVMVAWKGLIAIELLSKCLRETRPYEKEKGASEQLYDGYLKRLYMALRGSNGHVEDVLPKMKRDFENIPKYKDEKPLIGIIGEIFVRCHRFSNDDLIKKVEELGGEAWLAPVEEWVYYVNRMGLRKAWAKKDMKAVLDALLKRFVQTRVEHGYSRIFKGYLKTLKEPTTQEIMDKAAPYLHDSFEGETILSIGKAVDLIENGASGIINAMPFGCMPGTIVTALMRGITRDHDIPCISVPYDGTESPTVRIQLEAFMDQSNQKMQRDCK